MTVHQLSVFIENKSGALVRVLRLLKQANIQLIASTIADTADFGICRIICSQPEKACDVLKEAGVAVSLCEVFAVELDDRPGKAADAIELFASEGISIAYLYSFLLNGKGVLIFRTDNPGKAAEVIVANGLGVIEEKDLSRLL
ncbi:MAG: amino acid-binding protein [Bacteroidales bacterium]|nr:amino acid-binding protein [Bacteroidales bacterium]